MRSIFDNISKKALKLLSFQYRKKKFRKVISYIFLILISLHLILIILNLFVVFVLWKRRKYIKNLFLENSYAFLFLFLILSYVLCFCWHRVVRCQKKKNYQRWLMQLECALIFDNTYLEWNGINQFLGILELISNRWNGVFV